MKELLKMANSYVDALRGREKNTPTILSPRRQIVKAQKERCYMCEKSLSNIMCYFAEIEGPDMSTGINSKELRAVCSSCFFGLGPNPVKENKKPVTREIEKARVKEKKQEQEEVNLFKELRLKHNTKEEMWDQWK